MLGRKSYPREYIKACRTRVDAQLRSFKALSRAAGKDPKAASALESFEPAFFNNLVVVLDASFVHRLRGVEGKDGNPLNEVRVLGASIMENGEVMGADPTIKMDPAKSVLGYKVGDKIRVHQAEFARLADAFFAELEKKFGE